MIRVQDLTGGGFVRLGSSKYSKRSTGRSGSIALGQSFYEYRAYDAVDFRKKNFPLLDDFLLAENLTGTFHYD